MLRTPLVLGLTLAATGRIWAGEPPTVATDKPLARAAEVRLAIERSIVYLSKEGVTWKQKQQCAACHHVPYMAWALHEARDHGYRIDDKALDDVLTWALAERNHGQVFPDLPLDKKHSETDYLGPLLMALGVGADEHRTPVQESARRRLLAHALTQQATDGSWNPNGVGDNCT